MQKSYHFHVQNATTIKTFIAMAKIEMDTKSISAESVTTSLHPTDRAQRGKEWCKLGDRASGHILRVRAAGSRHFVITTMRNTRITVVSTKNVIILCLYLNQLSYQLHPCLSCLAKLISSVCVTRCRPSLWFYPCFIWVKTHFATLH